MVRPAGFEPATFGSGAKESGVTLADSVALSPLSCRFWSLGGLVLDPSWTQRAGLDHWMGDKSLETKWPFLSRQGRARTAG